MTAVTLICFRADADDPTIRTYAAVRSSEALAMVADAQAQFADAETLPWETLPGVKALVAADFRSRPPGSVAVLGTAEGHTWATWHLPVGPPPVPPAPARPAQGGERRPAAIGQERERRARTIAYLTSRGASEGRDWRWGVASDWAKPGVVDTGLTVEVQDRLIPKDCWALPIMIRSSGVRLLGGPMLAAAMDKGEFPAEMPFAAGKIGSLS